MFLFAKLQCWLANSIKINIHELEEFCAKCYYVLVNAKVFSNLNFIAYYNYIYMYKVFEKFKLNALYACSYVVVDNSENASSGTIWGAGRTFFLPSNKLLDRVICKGKFYKILFHPNHTTSVSS